MKGALRFHTLDVFTDRKFAGNPLAVIEDADYMTSAEMGVIAREFNFASVAFLRDACNPICAARIDIVAPSLNGSLAGHAAIGAAVLIAETRAQEMLARHDVIISLENGPLTIRCEVIKNRRGVSYAQYAASRLPERIGIAPGAEDLARALGLEPSDIGFKGHEPTIYSVGFPLLFAPIATRDALDRAKPNPAAFSEIIGVNDGAYLYTREPEDENCAVRARMFAKRWGAEDPATGAAAAAFAGVAHEFECPKDGEHQIFIEQGHKLGRPSRITLRMTIEGGRLVAVHIGGQAVRVSEGALKL